MKSGSIHDVVADYLDRRVVTRCGERFDIALQN
jgi:hypothetical protein